MLAARGSDSGVFLTSQAIAVLAAVAAVFIGIAAFILQYVTSVQGRQITYGMPISARLMNPSVVPDLHVLYREEELADPHVLEIALSYRGRKDISSASFEQGQPLCIDVGVPIIDLLETIFDPEEKTDLKVEAVETALKVGPGLLRKGHAMTFVVLTDGPGAQLTHDIPLADVKVRQVAGYRARQDTREARYRARRGFLKRTITWASVLFIMYYLGANPQGAVDLVDSVAGWLHGAGNSLSTFVNSL
jgi:hypothetical protein